MKIKEVFCKNILIKSRLPGCDYVINPYSGCAHNCLYCYASFMQKYTGHTESWGSYLDIKINAPDALKTELQKNKKGVILFSSVTDPYQPIEHKYELTKKCLEVLLPYQWPTSILTKSNLVLRDTDLLSQFQDCDIGFSINTTDEKIKKFFEPYSSTIEQRLTALAKLHETGLKTYAFISPLLPELFNLEALFQRLSGTVDWIGLENLNPYKKIWPNIKNVLASHFPKLLAKYQDYFQNKHRHDTYWQSIQSQISALSQRYSIPTKLYFHY